MITSLYELSKALKARLPDYLELYGMKPNTQGFIRCINPAHNDGSPSMKVRAHTKDPENFYAVCYGCGAKHDTISACALFNGFGLTGQDFVHTMEYAAKELDIPVNFTSLTAEDIKKQSYLQFYSIVDGVLSRNLELELQSNNSVLSSFVDSRAWDITEAIESFGLGYYSWPEFVSSMERVGYSESALRSFGLSDRFINANSLVFPFRDTLGNTVGYTSRYMGTPDKDTPKWNGSKLLDSPYFLKNNYLYNFNNASALIKKGKASTFYIVEGQGDALTLHQCGFAAVAICSSSFTDEHARLIRKLAPSNIVFALDGDSAGQEATVKLLQLHLSSLGPAKKFVLKIGNGEDPDSFIRKNGVTEFNSIPRPTAFTYLLDYYKDNCTSLEELAEKAVQVIATFPTAIQRESLVKEVAFLTDFSTLTLLEEVNAIVNKTEISKASRIKEAVEDAAYAAMKSPSEAAAILDEAKVKIMALDAEVNSDYLSGEFYSGLLSTFKEEFDSRGEDFPGYEFPMAPEFQRVFSNDWSKGKMIAIGGSENAGKSSFGIWMGSNLCLSETNNCRVIYMTIDDSVQTLFTKQVAIFSKWATKDWPKYKHIGGFPMHLNWVTRPNYWANVLPDGMKDDMFNALKMGYELAYWYAREERFMILGIPYVYDLEDFRRAAIRMRRQYPNDNIYMHIDNAHKLPVKGEPRLFYTSVSNKLKQMTNEFDISVGCTLEYNTSTDKKTKSGRPTNESLAEARAFKYDADAIIHLYNDLHKDPRESPWFHEVKHPWDFHPTKLPIVEAIIGKNKIDGNKGTEFFKFHPYASNFIHIPIAEAVKIAQANESGSKVESSDSDDWSIEEEL